MKDLFRALAVIVALIGMILSFFWSFSDPGNKPFEAVYAAIPFGIAAILYAVSASSKDK